MSSDISVPVIDRVMELTPATTLTVDGYTYLDKDKTLTLHKPPVPEPLKVSTLDGLVDLLEAQFEGDSRKTGDQMVHVVSHDSVQFLSKYSDDFGRRQSYIVATRMKPEQEFEFGKYIPQERFVIALRSLFAQSEQLDALVALAGNIAKETEVRQEDDGFSQRVTAKAGTHLVKETTVNPRVPLKPFRTFIEAEQPESVFLFRVKHDGSQGNLCALFEADGGGWKLQAMENVKTWISNRLKGSQIDGLSDIPVIA